MSVNICSNHSKPRLIPYCRLTTCTFNSIIPNTIGYRIQLLTTVTILPQCCQVITSSSAVAERPCDASCLSVVSFNSTKRRAVLLLVTYATGVTKRPCDASCLSVVSFNSTKRQAVLLLVTYATGVAERPCDASCLSVVSFNSTKRRAESFIVSSYRFIIAYK